MTNEFAAFVRENSKADKLRSDVSPVGDTNCIALLWDARPARLNGFIRKRRSLLR
jgi:hypothetical protein